MCLGQFPSLPTANRIANMEFFYFFLNFLLDAAAKLVTYQEMCDVIVVVVVMVV